VREKKRGKRIHKKEFPENVVAGGIVVCDRRAARQAQFVATLASRLQLDYATRNKSCHLLLVICLTFDEQSAPTETCSLCARKEKKGISKNILTKKNSSRLMLLADLTLAIDVQQK
jgi:hypothetical protein